MTTREQRPPYSGSQSSLVVSFDIGTTFSGASYSFLTPGEIPQIHSVTGYRGQEDQPSSSKVPTVLIYDSKAGAVVACGAEACDDVMQLNEDYLKVEWFKLLLRPKSFDKSCNPPVAILPPNKTVVDVLADFLRYMQACVQHYIQETTIEGDVLWRRHSPNARYILTHPNGWEGYQLDKMREAAVDAGLVPSPAAARERVGFISEGEASFHWCVDNGLATSALVPGGTVVVADAGGGTIDVTSFRISSLKPLRLIEAAPAECRMAGSVFVTKAFQSMATDKLKNSSFGDDEYIERLTEEFDKKTKCLFRDDSNATIMKIGTRRDNDSKHGIKLGHITFPGKCISSAFESSCHNTAEAIRVHVRNRDAHVFLVGGFAASPWLFSEVKRRLAGSVTDLKRADSHTAKAVAYGAIACYLDRAVESRVAKYTYGTDVMWDLDEFDPQHRIRPFTVSNVTGLKYVHGGYQVIMTKGQSVKRDTVYKASRVQSLKARRDYPFDVVITRYLGSVNPITFFNMDSGNKFVEVCRIPILLPASAFIPKVGPMGQFWEASFDTVLELGATELKGYVEWHVNGRKARSPIAPVWEEN